MLENAQEMRRPISAYSRAERWRRYTDRSPDTEKGDQRPLKRSGGWYEIVSVSSGDATPLPEDTH